MGWIRDVHARAADVERVCSPPIRGVSCMRGAARARVMIMKLLDLESERVLTCARGEAACLNPGHYAARAVVASAAVTARSREEDSEAPEPPAKRMRSDPAPSERTPAAQGVELQAHSTASAADGRCCGEGLVGLCALV